MRGGIHAGAADFVVARQTFADKLAEGLVYYALFFVFLYMAKC